MPLEQADQLDEGQSRVHMCLVTAMILEQSPDITREAVGRALEKRRSAARPPPAEVRLRMRLINSPSRVASAADKRPATVEAFRRPACGDWKRISP